MTTSEWIRDLEEESKSHSEVCMAALTPTQLRTSMGSLTANERQAVLTCPHYSHDVAKLVWRA